MLLWGQMATPKIELRVPVSDRELWEDAASGQGLSLSAWIRDVCNAECDASLRDVLGAGEFHKPSLAGSNHAPAILEGEEGPVARVFAKREAESKLGKSKDQDCGLVVPRGCRCKLCGKVHKV